MKKIFKYVGFLLIAFSGWYLYHLYVIHHINKLTGLLEDKTKQFEEADSQLVFQLKRLDTYISEEIEPKIDTATWEFTTTNSLTRETISAFRHKLDSARLLVQVSIRSLQRIPDDSVILHIQTVHGYEISQVGIDTELDKFSVVATKLLQTKLEYMFSVDAGESLIESSYEDIRILEDALDALEKHENEKIKKSPAVAGDFFFQIPGVWKGFRYNSLYFYSKTKSPLRGFLFIFSSQPFGEKR